MGERPAVAAPVPIAVRGVTKRYGGVPAVDDLSFEVAAATVAGFLGPNGAGKTTTLRLIGGLLRQTAGRIELFGIDARLPEARRRLGYMPADPAFLPHLTGRANLDLLARLRGDDAVPDRAVATEALGLDDRDLDRKVGGYSSGMRQKLAIVAAVQHRPDIVVLDEPANRLDPLAHRVFCDLLRSMADRGVAVLLSSHVLAEVEAVCDVVLIVREGRLLRTAPVTELREQAPRIVTLDYAEPPGHAPAALLDARVDGTRVVGRLAADRPDLVRAMLSDLSVRDITVAPASLEDVVLDLYAGRAG